MASNVAVREQVWWKYPNEPRHTPKAGIMQKDKSRGMWWEFPELLEITVLQNPCYVRIKDQAGTYLLTSMGENWGN